MSLITQAIFSFLLGAATTFTSLCLLPMYPNFISNLGERFTDNPDRKTHLMLSLLVFSGILTFMYSAALLLIIAVSGPITAAVGSVMPAIFGIFLVLGIWMMAGNDIKRYIPDFNVYRTENSMITAYFFGLLYGFIVLPCSPVFIAIFLARTILITDPLNTTINFMVFGIGIGFPLLLFSAISIEKSRKIVQVFSTRESFIDRASGLVIFVVAAYYLLFVFDYIRLIL